MSAETLEVIRRAYDGFRERDLGRVLDAMDEQVQLDARQALVHKGVYHGHAGIAQYLATIGDDWDEFDLSVDEISPSLLGHAMVVGRVCGIERASGDRVEAPFIHVLRVKRGKVTRLEVYVNRDHAKREMQRQETLAREAHTSAPPG